MEALNRFLRYVKVHTTSNPDSQNHPSSEIQKNLGNLLVEELHDLGIDNAYIDEHSYVYAKIERNSLDYPTIGLIAHLDTSPDISGENVNPRIIYDYDGLDVVLNKEENIVLKVDEFPDLKTRIGETLIVTDGLTLLGADDKAGICEIMTVCEYLVNNPEFKHGDILICFTPDEEIGEGTTCFDYQNFKCDFAYTVDGGKEGSIDYENFNAASCKVTINGVNIHPGSAKGHMVNSILVASEFNSLLPSFNIPANTELYEGFNHLNDIVGTVEKTDMYYIIRNHNMELFNKQKQDFLNIQEFINKKYFPNTCEVTIKDSYYNMYEVLKDHMYIVDLAIESIKEANLTPIITPIRGGTDGARLTFEGIICPNLGTGGANFHGRYEYITVEGIKKSIEVILNILKNSKNIK